MGGNNGAYRLSPTGEWENFTKEDGLKENHVDDIVSLPNGTFWFSFGQHGEEVSFLQPNGEWGQLGLEQGLVDANVQKIFTSADGTIWLGGSNGNSFFKP